MEKEIKKLLLTNEEILFDTIKSIIKYNNNLKDLKIYENDTKTLNILFSKGCKAKMIDYSYLDDYLIVDLSNNIHSYDFNGLIVEFKKHVNRITEVLINICLKLTTIEIYSKLDLHSDLVDLIEDYKKSKNF